VTAELVARYAFAHGGDLYDDSHAAGAPERLGFALLLGVLLDR
jgi:hypothetical protein